MLRDSGGLAEGVVEVMGPLEMAGREIRMYSPAQGGGLRKDVQGRMYFSEEMNHISSKSG